MSHYTAGAARRRCGAKFGDHLLRAQRVFALDEFAELVKRRLQRADELTAECGDADALDAVIGEDLYSEEFAQHAGHRRGSDQKLLERKTDKVDLNLLDFILPWGPVPSVDLQFVQYILAP
jgi:hypothetical protein